ncbi:MAG: hypothetical protein U0640_06385 [Phycisphaerales bacterium]
MVRRFALVVVSCVGLALGTRPASAQPISTAWTYQGQLSNNSVPASGTFDIRFKLFSAATGGTQQGPTLCVNDIIVTDGRFTVSLDFGNVFAGSRRFLEVDVRQNTGLDCSNSTGYTTLTPRQETTAAPYATYATTSAQATTASNATQLNGQPPSFYLNASNLTTGTLSPGRLPTSVPLTDALSTTFTGNITAPTFTGALTGTATNTLNLNNQPASFYQNATNLTSGLLSDSRLSTNIPRLNGANAFTNTNTFASTTTFNNDASFLTQVGIGVAATSSVPLWVQKASGGSNNINLNTVVAVENDTNAFMQFFTPGTNESGLLFGHTNPDPSVGAAVVYNNSLALQGLLFRTGGNVNRMTLTSTGRLGIGTTTPEGTLHVRSDDSLGTIVVTPGVTDTQSQLLLAENTSASNAMAMRYNGATNNLEFRGLAANVETPAHMTINRDSGALTVTPATATGDNSVRLPANSIGPAETSAEAGIASRIVATTSLLPENSTTTLCTRTINCPTSGYVIAIATTQLYNFSLFEKSVILGIMTSDVAPDTSQDYLLKFGSTQVVTIQRVETVTAGSYTFYFQARALDPDISTEQKKLTLMFFPTAYGTVDSD